MSTEKTMGLRTELSNAEKARKYISENNLLRKDLKVRKDNLKRFR